jgi:lysozyme family protein
MQTPAPSPDAVFDAAMAFVLRWEGGFVDHPADPGGATNHGISLRYARSRGRLLDLNGDGEVDAADIRLITPAVAATMYRKDFWWPVRAEALPPAIAVITFDAAINCGPDRARRWLQQAVGASADGIIGPRTLAAVAAADPRVAVREMLARRLVHHANLPTMSNFGLGWMRRVADLALFAARYLPHPPEGTAT